MPLPRTSYEPVTTEVASQIDDQIKALTHYAQSATGDAKRTHTIIASTTGAIVGTKQCVDTFRKDAMEEFQDVRADIENLRTDIAAVNDNLDTNTYVLTKGQDNLNESIRDLKDNQVGVRVQLTNLVDGQSRLNTRIDNMERMFDERFKQLEEHLDNQN